MKLAVWARKVGIGYLTANRMFHNGQLPVPAEQLPTGTIIVYPDESVNPQIKKTILYGRVSSHDQKLDLQRQMQRLRLFAAKRGLTVDQEVQEIASGLNDHRSKLLQVLRDPEVSTIVVEHRDRLARFGINLLEASLTAQNRKLIVMNQQEFKDDIVQDFVDVVTSMCSRIYGKRSAKNRAAKALKAVEVA